MSICLLDTSILCELLRIPDHCDAPEEIAAGLSRKIRDRESLLLPMSAIVETGNHIGQIRSGRQRRATAEKLVRLVRQAILGESPFTPTPFFESEALLAWLDEFPDWAVQGAGLADLTIKKEWDRLCLLHPQRRIYIWSLDTHLSSYDRQP
ncbi:MAG TPA: hypothetical protein DD490_29635 [Acidobacteria bacterium]|nr:hypothetical protein [Acidobacteriota bacterium]